MKKLIQPFLRSCILCLALVLQLCEPNLSSGAEGGDYRIAPGDKIFVDVFGEKDLQKELTVSASGEITFPLLGTVKARGLTALELQNRLKEDLGKDYLVDPQVTVSIREYRKRTVSVLGQVNNPGLVELPAEEKFTILEAIARSGGFTRLARKSNIQVTRSGVPRPYRFSEDDLRKMADPEKAFILQHGDIIMVDESPL
jgi:protein involved in polysaccharide export with SLBB domain